MPAPVPIKPVGELTGPGGAPVAIGPSAVTWHPRWDPHVEKHNIRPREKTNQTQPTIRRSERPRGPPERASFRKPGGNLYQSSMEEKSTPHPLPPDTGEERKICKKCGITYQRRADDTRLCPCVYKDQLKGIKYDETTDFRLEEGESMTATERSQYVEAPIITPSESDEDTDGGSTTAREEVRKGTAQEKETPSNTRQKLPDPPDAVS